MEGENVLVSMPLELQQGSSWDETYVNVWTWLQTTEMQFLPNDYLREYAKAIMDKYWRVPKNKTARETREELEIEYL